MTEVLGLNTSHSGKAIMTESTGYRKSQSQKSRTRVTRVTERLTANDQRCEHLYARPWVWIASPRDSKEKACEATTEEDQSNPIEFFDLLDAGLPIPMEVEEGWRPVETNYQTERNAVGNDSQVESPTPVQVRDKGIRFSMFVSLGLC